jgi:hypothetical protein
VLVAVVVVVGDEVTVLLAVVETVVDRVVDGVDVAVDEPVVVGVVKHGTG